MRKRRSRRWLVGMVAAGSAALLLPAPAAPAAAAETFAATTTPPHLVWRTCGDGFQCATARVPLDYDAPAGRRIQLALIRLPASAPGLRIGSLFVNPGGPGTSAVEFVRASARQDYPARVRARFDIVGMDPRGIGASTPVRCFASESDRQRFFADYNVLPVGHAELVAAARKAAELARSCEARAEWLLPHLSTANVARDLDLLRRAVGDARLSYVGYSYGTYLGATYANLFPGRVRALVLDGVTDPPAYTWGTQPSVPFIRAGAHIASWQTLEQFFALCARAGAGCDFSTGGDPRAKFAMLAGRLRAHPLLLPDGRRVGYAELVDLTVQTLYRAADWAGGAAILQQLYDATNPTPSVHSRNAAAAVPATKPTYSNELEGLFASVCSETSSPTDPFAYARVAARADRQAPYAGSLWTYRSLPCAGWPARDADRYTGPWRVRTSWPALLFNTRYDPATAHRNAVLLQGLLPGSRLVTVDGWGHTVRDTRSACAQRILDRYLVDQVLPGSETNCQPGIVPFG